MGRPTSPEQLAQEINKILDEYSEDLDEKIGEVMGKVGRKGVQLLKEKSPKADGTPVSGTYANGWALSVENHRNLTHEAVIYNRHPGMPHLLEYGHLTRDGNRTRAQEHIAPVEKTIFEEFNAEELLP